MFGDSANSSVFPHSHNDAVTKGSLRREYLKWVVITLLHPARLMGSENAFAG